MKREVQVGHSGVAVDMMSRAPSSETHKSYEMKIYSLGLKGTQSSVEISVCKAGQMRLFMPITSCSCSTVAPYMRSPVSIYRGRFQSHDLGKLLKRIRYRYPDRIENILLFYCRGI